MAIKRGFIDSSGRLLHELDEAERHAISAVGVHVAKNHTCMIAKNHGEPGLLGSGTFVSVGDRIFVATAKHLFDGIGDNDTIALYWGEDDQRAGAIKKDIVTHEQLDLAVVPMLADMPPCGVTLQNLDWNCASVTNGLFVVSGIPAEKFVVDEDTKTVTVAHWSLGLVRLPENAWPKHAEQPLSCDVDMLMNYTNRYALDEHGELMPQLDPHGLSGGGIWSVPIEGETVWSPMAARLVGVQASVETDKWRYLRATRIVHWVKLLVLMYPQLRNEVLTTFPAIGAQ